LRRNSGHDEVNSVAQRDPERMVRLGVECDGSAVEGDGEPRPALAALLPDRLAQREEGAIRRAAEIDQVTFTLEGGFLGGAIHQVDENRTQCHGRREAIAGAKHVRSANPHAIVVGERQALVVQSRSIPAA
jgi:hypothetical protein